MVDAGPMVHAVVVENVEIVENVDEDEEELEVEVDHDEVVEIVDDDGVDSDEDVERLADWVFEVLLLVKLVLEPPSVGAITT